MQILSPLVAVIFLSSCAAFQVSGEIQRGRRALFNNNPESALARFQSAAKLDPNYTFKFSPFQPSVLSYIGRAYYAMGKLSEAKGVLERARKEHPEDPFASLYLGLVLLRQNQSEAGIKETASALRSLRATLTYVTDRTAYGRYWDPGRKIEEELNHLIAAVGSAEGRSNGLIPRLEWIGNEIDEELDQAREDRAIDFRESDDGTTGD